MNRKKEKKKKKERTNKTKTTADYFQISMEFITSMWHVVFLPVHGYLIHGVK